MSLALADTVVTLGSGERVDELDSPEAATQWLIDQDLAPETTALLAYCQSRLAGLREDLRAVMHAQVAGEVPPREALENINSALVAAPSARMLHHTVDRGLHRVPIHPLTQLVEHAMAQIAEDAADLLTGPEAGRLALCGAAPCDRFYLRTHGRRQWCSTRCGDRVRAARSYARSKGGQHGRA
ncbi:CGNR zinc finger domain-containing protein [Brachybacterium saurashtrense]|nr:ABATE domain-containing protein [Brachybacterium saurashtrense]